MTTISELFKFPLQLVVVGRTRSGKSHLIRKTILPAIIKDYDEVFIFSPTAFLDAGWKLLKKKYKKKIQLFDEFENDQILQLVVGIGQAKEAGGKTKYLMLFDDITDRLSQSPKSYFSKLAIYARHYDISYITTSHKFRALNRMMRNNATSKIFFKINSVPELNAVTDENATANVSTDMLAKIVNQNTGDYNSFFIQNGPDDDDYYRIAKSGKIIKLENKKEPEPEED